MSELEGRLGEDDGEGIDPRRAASSRVPRSSVSDERYANEREASDRDMAEDRELSEDERFEMYAASHYQSILPDLPIIPGFHTFWATTTNGRDSVHQRLRMGYSVLRVEECPGWEGIGVQAANFTDVVGVNEMIAMKIPLSLYRRFMRHSHHDLPLQEEEKLRHQVEELKEQLSARNSKVFEGDGTAEEFARNASRPVPQFG